MPTVTFNLPPVTLKVNKVYGSHWGASYKAKRGYQQDCMAVLQGMRWKDVESRWPVSMTITAYIGKGMHLPDLTDLGAWAKTNIDCLVAFGVFPDDSPRYINRVTLLASRDWDTPRLEIKWEGAA